MDDKEKLYKKLSFTGAGNIAVGIVLLVIGIACGVMTIVNGAMMLSGRKNVLI